MDRWVISGAIDTRVRVRLLRAGRGHAQPLRKGQARPVERLPRHRVGDARARRRPRPRRRADRHPRQPDLGALGERDRVELNRRITAWRLSVLVYGEQGAMLACSQLVDIVPGSRREVLPGHPGHGRGAAQRGPRALYPDPARRPALPDAGERALPLRRDPHRPPLVHQDHRAPARRRDLRGVHVQDDGRGRRRSRPRRGVPAHPAGRVAPHGLRHARPAHASSARPPRPSGGRWRTSPAWPWRRS